MKCRDYPQADSYMDGSFAAAIAGFCASASTVVFFPLEMAKVRMMVSDGHSRNHVPYFNTSYQVLRSLYNERGFSGLYKGCQVSVISNVAWMTYFYFYATAKKRYSQEFVEEHAEMYKFLTAAEAAVLARIATNPLWVIKTRVMLQQYHSGWMSDTLEAGRKIYRLEGLKGYWSGLPAGLILSSNGAVQLYLYETIKQWSPVASAVGTASIAGGLSKLLSSVLLYPMQTVMVRLQQEQYSSYIFKLSTELQGPANGEPLFLGMWHCMEKTLRLEGPTGFYRGLGVHLLRLVPANALFFVVYERVLRLLV